MAPNASLARFARFSSAAAFLLIAAGGMVTSTGSSLAVPDWPLSYGQYFPRMTGGVIFEHGHRMIAGAVAALTWALALWIWLKEPRRWVRWIAAAAAFGILLQAVLGGITVLYGLPHWVSIFHACLGQTLFCLLLTLAEATGWEGSARSSACGGLSWKVGAAAAAALFVQLVFGAVLRHTGSALPLHLLGALAVSVLLGWTVHATLSGFPEARPLRGPALLLAGALPLQLILGLAALAARGHRAIVWSALLPTAHQACGALILGTTVVWTLRAFHGGAE